MAQTGKVRPFTVSGVVVFALVACFILYILARIISPPEPKPRDALPTIRHPGWNPERVVSGSFVQPFGGAHDEANWYKSDFLYPNPAHPAWKADLIHFLPDRIELEVRRERIEYKTIAGAEYQRRGFYHFGRYEVVMKAAPGSGTVSAMFTHTHDQFGDPHDEIDIEFLGNRPRELHLNYFTNGAAAGSIYVPVGFDTSKEVHLYAFEWEPDEIRWYVDDTLLYTAKPEDHPIPQAPGRLMVHLWSGGQGQRKWHGRPTFKDGTRAAVYCLSFKAKDDQTRQCSDTFKAQSGKKT